MGPGDDPTTVHERQIDDFLSLGSVYISTIAGPFGRVVLFPIVRVVGKMPQDPDDAEWFCSVVVQWI